MEDRDRRRLIVGRWTCENKWMPHKARFHDDGTLSIVMATGNVAGGLMSFVTGERCEGTWAIHDGILRISFDKVPDSWLNMNFRLWGLDVRLPVGDFLTKATSLSFGLSQLTRCKILRLDGEEMELAPYRGWWSASDQSVTWSRDEAGPARTRVQAESSS